MGQCAGKVASTYAADNGLKKDIYKESYVKKHEKVERFNRRNLDDITRQNISLENSNKWFYLPPAILIPSWDFEGSTSWVRHLAKRSLYYHPRKKIRRRRTNSLPGKATLKNSLPTPNPFQQFKNIRNSNLKQKRPFSGPQTYMTFNTLFASSVLFRKP